ncbi:hypothetical protein NUU61_003399 [Penicillium alfredii]|uniref:Uncharacterized protein n=1 Tax=Penicillium alfredii TaxID=1506179 RepID=A0A9W9KI41_9EURO|nr:uncharacterized protein NUU61_003399 [Penicillium alfredii]KAJ5106052.1 hypothetical protein NUU61_003399 [Penicillium alfredii]
MLHPISDNRMSGSSMRNLEMMKTMCGFTTYDNLVIATTMWPETPSYTGAVSLGTRESELLSDERFFGALVTRGATVFRHNEKGHQASPEWMASAQRIVAHLILQAERHPPGALQLQREMIEHKKALGETEAGIAVARDLYKAQQAHKRQLQQLEARYEAEKSQRNVDHAADLHDLRVELEKKLEGVEKDKQTLRSSMQEMYQKEKEALKERTKAFEKKLRADLAAKEQELGDMEDSLKAIRQDMARRSKTPSQDKQVIQIARHEEEACNVREKVSEAQTSHKEFVGQTEHFLGNGIPSGVAAGVIAGGQGFQSSALVYSDGAQAFAGNFLCTVM